MTTPTQNEVHAFIERLRTQASFLGDPALTEAADFMERVAPCVPDSPASVENDDATRRRRAA